MNKYSNILTMRMDVLPLHEAWAARETTEADIGSAEHQEAEAAEVNERLHLALTVASNVTMMVNDLLREVRPCIASESHSHPEYFQSAITGFAIWFSMLQRAGILSRTDVEQALLDADLIEFERVPAPGASS